MKSKKMIVFLSMFTLALGLSACSKEASPDVQTNPPDKKTETISSPVNHKILSYAEAIQAAQHPHLLQLDPKLPNRLWMGSHGGLYFSNKSNEWMLTNPSLAGKDVMGLFINPANPNNIIITGHGFANKSDDGGQSWSPAEKGLPSQPDIHLFYGYREGEEEHLLAYIVGSGIYESNDGAKTWNKLLDTPEKVFGLTYDSENKRVVMVSDQGLIYNNEGNWEVDKKLSNGTVLSVANLGSQLIVSTKQGIFVRDEAGNWIPDMNDGLQGIDAYFLSAANGQLAAMTETGEIYFYSQGKWSVRDSIISG